MRRLLSLARAARLVGLPRAELQQRVADGRLPASDGLVALEDLQSQFPDIALGERLQPSGALEQVGRLREQAFGSRMRELLLPSAEVLAQRLYRTSGELADVRRHLQDYHSLLTDLRARIASAEPRAGLLAALDQGLMRILGSATDPIEETLVMLESQTAHVTVRPSGHDFLVEGNDSLLQAGLKAGLPLGYGCGSGNCGLCKARIISGEVRQIAHSDYRLSALEREQGIRLLCAHTAVGDVVIETIEASGPGDIPTQHIAARVRAYSSLAGDTYLLHLQTPRSQRLRFLAGQSVTLGLPRGDEDIAESLPIASCPCDERNLYFHIGSDAPGPLSRYLTRAGVQLGEEINIRGPYGDFVLDDTDPSAPLFVACDLGFAPIKALIEQAIALDRFPELSLYWLATRQGGHYFGNLGRSWAASLDHFRYVALSDAGPGTGAQLVAARLLTDLSARASPPLYVSGVAAFVDPLLSSLATAGMDPTRAKVHYT